MKRKRPSDHPPQLPTALRIRRKVGQGSYASVYDARWNGKTYAVKVCHVAGPAHAATLDSEAKVQRDVFRAYAAAVVHLPVYHPFPALYGYYQGEHHGQPARFTAMFKLSQLSGSDDPATMVASVASVLHTVHAHTPMRFMHRDLHLNNVMRRSTRAFDLAWGADGRPDVNDANYARGRYVGSARARIRTDAEYSIVDFGMARVEQDGVVTAPANAVYRHAHAFDAQHDLRLLAVSIYDHHVADRVAGRERSSLPRAVLCIQSLVNEARRTSPRFAAVTDLDALAKVGRMMTCCSSEDEARQCVVAMGTRFGIVVSEYETLWVNAWRSETPPPMHHFLYANAVGWGDTPVFSPSGALAALFATCADAAVGSAAPKLRLRPHASAGGS